MADCVDISEIALGVAARPWFAHGGPRRDINRTLAKDATNDQTPRRAASWAKTLRSELRSRYRLLGGNHFLGRFRLVGSPLQLRQPLAIGPSHPFQIPWVNLL